MIGGLRFSRAARRNDSSCVLSPISARATTDTERRKASRLGSCPMPVRLGYEPSYSTATFNRVQLLLARASPHLDRAVASAFLHRLHLGDLARSAGARGRARRLGCDRRAGVAEGADEVAVRAALAESLHLGVALRLHVDRVPVRARLGVVGDRTPQLAVAVPRAGRVERDDQQGDEHQDGCEGAHGYFTRARIARSSPTRVAGYMRPPMISLMMPIDCR